jgi:hypothetical protein
MRLLGSHFDKGVVQQRGEKDAVVVFRLLLGGEVNV